MVWLVAGLMLLCFVALVGCLAIAFHLRFAIYTVVLRLYLFTSLLLRALLLILRGMLEDKTSVTK
jgi:hypothetical protein